MSEITVPKDEHGKLRVFALSMSDDAARALNDNDHPTSADHPHPQERALGTSFVDAKNVEVFRVGDLGPLGLAGYLREGADANEAEITQDASKLAAVDGWVMVVYSSAFGGAEAKLDPIPELTLIGTYAQEQADQTTIALESEAAAPYTGVPSEAPSTPPKNAAGGSLVVVGLVVLIALILWWAFG
ncbi:hypothetical protein [Sulfitobacter sp. MF3-043]|uniref:hypothetical protein n=1 Tax=Sulfitobacter sediminivivens TaxID=3252902 RepID=UPI0036DB57DE